MIQGERLAERNKYMKTAFLFFFAALLLVLTACDQPAENPFEDFEVIDLTHVYDDETLYWPTSPSAFEHEELAYGMTDAGYFYASYWLGTPEHGGTHIDAPIHFYEDRRTVDQIPAADLMLPVFVIDVSEYAAADPDYVLSLEDIHDFEAEYGEIPSGGAVLMRAGWSQYWPDALSYLGDDTPGDASNLHFPGFGPKAMRFLIEERGVKLIGVDTASIDHGPSKDFPVHQITGEHNVPGLENLANLDALPPAGAFIIALPMNIGGGSGAPTRVVGMVRK